VRLISLCFVLQALRLLSEDFVQKHPGLKQQVVLQLLNNSVVLGHNRKVAVEAISVLQGHSEALLSGMIPCSPSAFGCCYMSFGCVLCQQVIRCRCQPSHTDCISMLD
jgi:hypothetical protein